MPRSWPVSESVGICSERVNLLNFPRLYHGRPSCALCRTSFAFHPCTSVTALCGHRAASIVIAVMDRIKKEGETW